MTDDEVVDFLAQKIQQAVQEVLDRDPTIVSISIECSMEYPRSESSLEITVGRRESC